LSSFGAVHLGRNLLADNHTLMPPSNLEANKAMSSQAAALPSELRQSGSSALLFDKFTIVPILFYAHYIMIRPVLERISTGPAEGGEWNAAQLVIINGPHPDTRIVMLLLFAASVLLILRHWSTIVFPSHIRYLFAFVAFSGLSTFWSIKPDLALSGFILQVMQITIILPAMLAARNVDPMRGLFLCYALAMAVDAYFVIGQAPHVAGDGRVGYLGYHIGKGELGLTAVNAVLLGLYEASFSGVRRVLGIIVIAIAIYLANISDARGPLSFGLFTPILAGVMLFAWNKIRIHPVVTLLSIAGSYLVLSVITGNLTSRLSWHLHHNYTLTGRTLIWDFVNFEIARKPFLGWGYQSFWFAGPDSPAAADAPGWIKVMPCGHNGYLDTILELGYIGFPLLLIFILATVHAISRVAKQDPKRGWFLLSIALYVILMNFIESKWMMGSNELWLMFLPVALEAGRYSARLPDRTASGPAPFPAR
jgi:exopolysaccharide production protein ExoQ